MIRALVYSDYICSKPNSKNNATPITYCDLPKPVKHLLTHFALLRTEYYDRFIAQTSPCTAMEISRNDQLVLR